MRRQGASSNCGFACGPIWRNLNSATLATCNACRSSAGKSKVDMDLNPPTMNGGANGNLLGNSSMDQISSPNSTKHQNGQIGMIFGKLPIEPTLALQLTVNGNISVDPKVKLEVFTDDDYCESGAHHQFYCAKSSAASFLGDSRIQIKQEYDCDEQALPKWGNQPLIWNSIKVQKKKRSKLPQYTMSPLERLINQLHHVSYYSRTARPYHKSNKLVPTVDQLKLYDDVLIYQKCMYVAENEVGLGAKLLSPPSISTAVIKEECSSTNESGEYFSCLIDVPIRNGDSDQ